MLDVTSLRVLVEIARHGSYSAAARELGYSQPAVTYHVRNLEKTAGSPITVRRGRRSELTAAGAELLVHAERILAAVRGAENALAAHAGQQRGVVRVAAFPSAYTTLAVTATAALQASNPELDVMLTEAEPSVARRLVRSGEIDLALCYRFTAAEVYQPPPDPQAQGLHRLELLRDRVLAVLPAGHRLARRRSLSPADLAHETFRLGGAGFLAMLQVAGEMHHFTPKVTRVADDYVALQSMVALGLGVALVPALAFVAHRDPRVVAIPLAGWPDRMIGVELWHDLLRLGPVRRFLTALTDAAAAMPDGAAGLNLPAGAAIGVIASRHEQQ